MTLILRLSKSFHIYSSISSISVGGIFCECIRPLYLQLNFYHMWWCQLISVRWWYQKNENFAVFRKHSECHFFDDQRRNFHTFVRLDLNFSQINLFEIFNWTLKFRISWLCLFLVSSKNRSAKCPWFAQSQHYFKFRSGKMHAMLFSYFDCR